MHEKMRLDIIIEMGNWNRTWLFSNEPLRKSNRLLLQHTATHCNTRQHTATQGNTLQLNLMANIQIGHTAFLVELRKSSRPFDVLPTVGNLK